LKITVKYSPRFRSFNSQHQWRVKKLQDPTKFHLKIADDIWKCDAPETAPKGEWHLKMKEAMTRTVRESPSGRGEKKFDQPCGKSLHPEVKVLHYSALQISTGRFPKRPNANGGGIQRVELFLRRFISDNFLNVSCYRLLFPFRRRMVIRNRFRSPKSELRISGPMTDFCHKIRSSFSL
jgi:hypothetical protein